MKFRTEIDIKPWQEPLEYSDRILCLGSCFATNIAQRLSQRKFRVASSPTGILFNPASIALAIERLVAYNNGDINALPQREELQYANGLWFHYDFHSSFSHSDADKAIEQIQRAVKTGAEALKLADTVIITLGTSLAYRHTENGQIVANCHKQPQRLFQREMLDIEAISERYIKLCLNLLGDKHIIFTVSPIRHLSDGLEINSLSKAVLRVALDRIAQHADNVTYFPSFEIMNDELRDYRFYAEDRTHPTPLAINYIWERFAQAAFSDETTKLIAQIEQIATDVAHRPFNPSGEAYKTFCIKNLARIEELNTEYPLLDFTEEKRHFSKYL